MTGSLSILGRCNARMNAVCARAALLAILMMIGSLFPTRESVASTLLIAASQSAEAGLDSCSNNRGRVLYDCVASVLDRLSNDLSDRKFPETKRTLATAASQLRTA